MLVLTRKNGEEIIIGQGLVSFKILDATKGQVKIGISAASSISIHRKEILDKIAPGLNKNLISNKEYQQSMNNVFNNNNKQQSKLWTVSLDKKNR